ncbi:hypothetical protein [Cylindrospermopsis curvispora]|uniref:hypothetical protein n=1 Tax=Cylindrospermopsis curvispora TaxID=747548 RepID=UPI001F16DC91|nr:hypothetical protein [Cylindrospermopsis curvispora]
MYFKTGYIPSRADLHKQLGTYQKNVHYQALYSDTSQQILTSVIVLIWGLKTIRSLSKFPQQD